MSKSARSRATEPVRLTDPVTRLAGVGERIAAQLARRGVYQVADLLWHLPQRYEDRGTVRPLASVLPGDSVLIEVEIVETRVLRHGKARQVALGQDDSGHITLWQFGRFGELLQTGRRYLLFGEVRVGAQGLEMAQPERVQSAALESILPVYPSTEGVTQARWRALIAEALTVALHELDELLPTTGLPPPLQIGALAALQRLHAPTRALGVPDPTDPARVRLAVEELMAQVVAVRAQRSRWVRQSAPVFREDSAFWQRLLADLPFSPTAAQSRVLAEILADLRQPHPMLRLVQGDVGSGKTLVAVGAALHAIDAGYQVALMAPTALLAEQHARNFARWLTPLCVPVHLLSGQMTAGTRRDVLAALQAATPAIVIGTHALFQEAVQFARLGLIIIDEQHRFGVHQRLALSDKGALPQGEGLRPHQLVMTATPIPRTLAMSAYADLAVSIIDELPPGRRPIKTTLLRADRREALIERISAVCRAGRQAYWVCPLIDASTQIEAEAAESTAARLTEALPHLRIGLVHGRMSAAQKQTVMAQFQAHALDVLVATTVIEVGVDVPNASLMMIENADRLGLAQLHQLRGRVGRGSTDSYCVLLYDEPLSDRAKARLALMRETQDGFVLAEADLAQRGPGEVLGTRQTGLAKLKVADLVRDADWVPLARALADQWVAENHPGIPALLQRWVGVGQQYGQV
ncbi:ATP-dependent DNA helicase RecG [Halothiobacillus sp. DCM-1]|uniref:ATP-dependent DNA helicase RecG n=1 Tax=Halothiobacillus sp. DCM-1 TaxID=3112558 RepID=UPI0032450298